ncbi:glycosyltransferase [Aestuariibacter sp. GS-14]|uniref:glycosyltransferase family 2 protein n=1 Tax=Aestuariibacter sp. GS-14 TaxID=2590670 RepID=UPI00112E5718|nr:glycosyltransferase family 2 protein [Aestuariibacter sp. GS-14]TPV55144.1 glycosyltransferase [Aestuariibacter sp. GS-14]
MMTLKFGIGMIPKPLRDLAKRNAALTSFYSHSLQKSGLFYGFPSKKKLQELYSHTLSYQAIFIEQFVSEQPVVNQHFHVVIRAYKHSNIVTTLKSLLIHKDYVSDITIIGEVISEKTISDVCASVFNVSVYNSFQHWDVRKGLTQVVFINSGDTLHHRFFDVCSRVDNQGLLYVDTDFVNLSGEREDARLLPDWNPYLQMSSHYIATGIVLNIEKLRSLLIRSLGKASTIASLINVLANEQSELPISHIALSLVHHTNNKTRSALESKETSKYLNEKYDAVSKRNKDTETLAIQWPLTKQPLVSLIIPTKNAKALVKDCIESILTKTTYNNYEIILVDNNSDEQASLDYFDELNQHPKITLLKYPQPFNYSAINNFAVKQCKGEVIGLVNNDIEVITPTWLDFMVGHVMREDIGCVGAKLLYSDGRVQHAGVVMGYGGGAGHAHKYFPRYHPGYLNRLIATNNFSAVTAACLLVKRTHYEDVNGLNEKDLTVAFNDVDFCLKVRELGVRNLYCAEAELYHHESVSRGLDVSKEKMARFNRELAYLKEQWGHIIEHDPAYNPNLTLRHENFAIKDEKERREEARKSAKA